MSEQATQYPELPIPLGIDTASQPELVPSSKALSIRNCHVGNGALIERRNFTRIARSAWHDVFGGSTSLYHGDVRALLPLGNALMIATEESRLYVKSDIQTGPWTEIERNDAPVSFKRALHSGALRPGDEPPYRYRNPNIAVSGNYACITWWRRTRIGGEESPDNIGWAMIYDLANQLVVRIDNIAEGVGIGTVGTDGSNPSLVPVAAGGAFFVLWIDTTLNAIRYRGISNYAATWSSAGTLQAIDPTKPLTFDACASGSVVHVVYNGATVSAVRATASGSALTPTSSVSHGVATGASALAVAVSATRLLITESTGSGTVFAWCVDPATMGAVSNGGRTQVTTLISSAFKQLSCCIYTITDKDGGTEEKATIAWTYASAGASAAHERIAFYTWVATVAVEHLTSHTVDTCMTAVRGVNQCHQPFRLSDVGTSTDFAPSFIGMRRNQDFEDTYYTWMFSFDGSTNHAVSPPITGQVVPVARYSPLTAGYVRGTDNSQDIEEQGVCKVVEYGGRYHWIGVEQVPTSQDEATPGQETIDTLHIYSLDFRPASCWGSLTYNGATLIAGSIPRMVSPEMLNASPDAVERRGLEGIVPTQSPPVLTLTAAAGGALDVSSTYYYATTYEYTDVTGRRHRSAPTPLEQSVALGVGQNRVEIDLPEWQWLQAGYRHHTLVIWRSEGNPADTDNITFYRLTEIPGYSIETSAITGYIDDAADSTITDNEVLYTVSGELENFPPPPSLALCLWKNRIVALDSETGKLWPSKTLLEREWPGFHEGLAVGTDVHTSLPVWLSEDTDNLIVWWSDAIGISYGEPGSDTGAIGSITQPRLLGQRGIGLQYVKSLVRTPIGHMFKSARGFYLLDPSMQLTYIGHDVEAYNSHVVVGAYVANTPNGSQEVRFETQTADSYADGYCTLVYDLVQQAWHVHTRGRKPLAAASINGNIYLATQALGGTDTPWDPDGSPDKSGVWVESTSTTIPTLAAQDPSGVYGTTLDMAWLTFAGKLGTARVRRLWIHGYLADARDVSITTYVDLDGDTIVQGPASIGHATRRRVEFSFARQECDSLRMVIKNFQRLIALRLEVEAQKGSSRRNNHVTG